MKLAIYLNWRPTITSNMCADNILVSVKVVKSNGLGVGHVSQGLRLHGGYLRGPTGDRDEVSKSRKSRSRTTYLERRRSKPPQFWKAVALKSASCSTCDRRGPDQVLGTSPFTGRVVIDSGRYRFV